MQKSRTAPALTLTAGNRAAVEACHALDDIARLLASGSPDQAVLSGIRHILADRPRWPPLPPDYPRAGYLAPGSTGADAAGMIRGLMEWRTGPFTTTLAELTRGLVTTDPDLPAEGIFRRPGQDAAVLGVTAAAPVWERAGRLIAAGIPAAVTRLILVPGRIPARAFAEIQAGQPCGEVLGPLGMIRDGRHAELRWPADPAVQASAVLRLDGQVVGLAAEDVTAGLCEQLAKDANARP